MNIRNTIELNCRLIITVKAIKSNIFGGHLEKWQPSWILLWLAVFFYLDIPIDSVHKFSCLYPHLNDLCVICSSEYMNTFKRTIKT